MIPARGGSKRILHKNIKLFHGKPIIGWSIEVARESGIFDRIIVSTDSTEIEKIALEFGAEVPFKRPKSLSDDFSPIIEVIRHSLTNLKNVDKLCCLFATAPFVSIEDLKKSFQMLGKGADFVVPVTTFPYPIERSLKISSNNLRMRNPELYLKRSQDFEESYHDAGYFYWGTSKSWNNFYSPFEGASIPLIISRKRVQDIDTHEDWKRAEVIFKNYLKNKIE